MAITSLHCLTDSEVSRSRVRLGVCLTAARRSGTDCATVARRGRQLEPAGGITPSHTVASAVDLLIHVKDARMQPNFARVHNKNHAFEQVRAGYK